MWTGEKKEKEHTGEYHTIQQCHHMVPFISPGRVLAHPSGQTEYSPAFSVESSSKMTVKPALVFYFVFVFSS